MSTIEIASVGAKGTLAIHNIDQQFKMGQPFNLEIVFLGIYSVEILTQVFKESILIKG